MNFAKLSWVRILILLLFCLVSAALGAFLVTSLFLSNLGNTKLVQEKITQKEVYIENSAKTFAIEKATNSLVSIFTEEEYQKYQNPNGETIVSCAYEQNCLRNGVVLTSDGLVASRLSYFNDKDVNSTMVAIDSNKTVYDFVLLAKQERFVLGKLLLRGEAKLDQTQRNKKLNFVASDFANLSQLKLGQEVLALEINQQFGASKVCGSLISNVLDWKGTLAGFEMATGVNNQNIAFGSQCNGNFAYFNLDGQLLGLAQTDGLFLPVNEISNILNRFEKNSKEFGQLDWKMNFYFINQLVKEKESLPIDYGIRITQIEKGGIAAKTGLKEQDIIVSINGKSLLNENFLDQINTLIAGESIRFSIFRDGKKQDIQLSL